MQTTPFPGPYDPIREAYHPQPPAGYRMNFDINELVGQIDLVGQPDAGTDTGKLKLGNHRVAVFTDTLGLTPSSFHTEDPDHLYVQFAGASHLYELHGWHDRVMVVQFKGSWDEEDVVTTHFPATSQELTEVLNLIIADCRV